MKKLISYIISRLRSEEFSIDANIPTTYLIRTAIGKFIAYIYGLIILRHRNCFISPSATIKCPSKIRFSGDKHFLMVGRHCLIDALSTEGILLGDGVSIGEYTNIECSGSLKHVGKGIIIGNNVGLGSRNHFGCAGGITIGDNTIFGSYVTLHSENHLFSDLEKPIRMQGVSHKGIIIGEDCWIGAKSTILDGTTIGKGCIVGAGAVVTGKFPDYSIIAGVPARIIRYRNDSKI